MNMTMIDANLLLIFLGLFVALMGIILAVYGISTWLIRKNLLSSRVEQFVSQDDLTTSIPTDRPIIPREVSGSLFNRIVISSFKKIFAFLGRFTPQKMVLEIDHKLAIAGNPGNLHASDFYALRFIVLMAGIVLGVLLIGDLRDPSLTSVLPGLLVIVILFLLPDLWLNGRIRTRQDAIRRDLPDALDMLSVCAMAGLGFDQSLQKISQYWDTELGYEINRTTQEMEMGVSRSEALKNLADRLEVDDLSRFVAIMIQADKVGMSYADVLHSQALQLRVLRQYRAREIANRLPGKIILPVALFIFPAIIAVILGPALPTLLGLFQ